MFLFLETTVHRGFGCSSIPYQEFEDEPGSTSEEVKSEPTISFDCAYCNYRSPTAKGLRCHRLTVHKIGLGVRRTLDSHGRPLTYFGCQVEEFFSFEFSRCCLDREFSRPTAVAMS
ncbi:uncharacterized protein TNCV_173301 [Trichonephila clavipes]|nr:uncharacterized protein TNCV_173301 [Trichonephila clavipes]